MKFWRGRNHTLIIAYFLHWLHFNLLYKACLKINRCKYLYTCTLTVGRVMLQHWQKLYIHKSHLPPKKKFSHYTWYVQKKPTFLGKINRMYIYAENWKVKLNCPFRNNAMETMTSPICSILMHHILALFMHHILALCEASAIEFHAN